MTTVNLSLKEIYNLAEKVMLANGCDAKNASALADIVCRAERDGSHSHGLFRVPGYVKSLRSGKVDGSATPSVRQITPAIIQVDGECCLAPMAQTVGLPLLAEATHSLGIAALSLVRIHHYAALWPETEYLADRGLVGIACTAATSMVAPAGSKRAMFGTNPLSFAWPCPGRNPIVYDMASAGMAMGDVQIAAREGRTLAPGIGLDFEGNATTDARAITGGVLLPFGGYKGSAISLMVELLAAGLTGDQFSYEASATDNKDGGPSRGGEIIIGMAPSIIAGPKWEEHVEAFVNKLNSLEGVRMPGARRHKNRLNTAPRSINSELIDTIKALL